MNVKAYRTVGLVLGLFVLFLWTRQAQAQESAVVATQPAALSLTTGENGLIAIAIKEASEVFGYELQLTFDPAVVQIIDANPDQPGVQIQPAGFIDESQGFTVVNRVDNSSGAVDYAMTLLAPAEPVSGAGTLLELGVLAIAPGSSPLALSVVLASRDGLELPVETIDGTLSVTGSQPPGGVPTGTAEVNDTAPATTPAIETPTSPTPVVRPTDGNEVRVPRQASSESSEAGGSVTPFRRSGNNDPQSLPAANALQTVSALKNAVPTSGAQSAPTAEQEVASATDPGDINAGEVVVIRESATPVMAVTFAGNQSENNMTETSTVLSPATVGLLAGAALIILVGVLFGRRLLAKL